MRIRITKCNAFGPQFTNLTPRSDHEVIKEKRSKKKSRKLEGYWVMGVGEKVVVLIDECVCLGDDDEN